MFRRILTKILVAVFTLSLINGMAVAQTDKTATKPTATAASSVDLVDINSATKD